MDGCVPLRGCVSRWFDSGEATLAERVDGELAAGFGE
jgi:hypothetical protein